MYVLYEMCTVYSVQWVVVLSARIPAVTFITSENVLSPRSPPSLVLQLHGIEMKKEGRENGENGDFLSTQSD